MDYQDILFEEKNRVATITLNRPDRYNALRAPTYDELLDAIQRGGWNRDNCAIVLTGAGERAFCTGGDQQDKASGARQGRGTVKVPIEQIHAAIRDVPVPVIAKVRGFAIGGGNVLATLCVITIAAENAVFDQLDAEVDAWCAELTERSPTAIAIAKRSFNADTDHIRGIGSLGFEALALFYGTEESWEGRNAFREKRKPDFAKKRVR